MTTSTDDVPRSTAVPGKTATWMTAHQPDATGGGSPGPVTTLLKRLADAQVRMVRSWRPGQPDEAESGVLPSKVESAGAASLPSRRVVLAILVGAGGVRSLPKLPVVVGATAGGDADLLDLAARTEALSVRFRTAVALLVAVDTKVDKLVPPRPKPPVHGGVQGTAGFAAAQDTLPVRRDAHGPPCQTIEAARIEHEADVASWEAACLAIARRCGRMVALRKYGRTNRHLVRSAVALAGVQASSREGTLAKARVCVQVFDAYSTCDPPDWLSALIQSTLRDVVATGRKA